MPCLSTSPKLFGLVRIVMDPIKLFWTRSNSFGQDQKKLFTAEFFISVSEELLNSQLSQRLKVSLFLKLSFKKNAHCYQLFVEKDKTNLLCRVWTRPAPQIPN